MPRARRRRAVELLATWGKATAEGAELDKACQGRCAQFPAVCKAKAVHNVVTEMTNVHRGVAPETLFAEAATLAGGTVDIGAQMGWHGEAAN